MTGINTIRPEIAILMTGKNHTKPGEVATHGHGGGGGNVAGTNFNGAGGQSAEVTSLLVDLDAVPEHRYTNTNRKRQPREHRTRKTNPRKIKRKKKVSFGSCFVDDILPSCRFAQVCIVIQFLLALFVIICCFGGVGARNVAKHL